MNRKLRDGRLHVDGKGTCSLHVRKARFPRSRHRTNSAHMHASTAGCYLHVPGGRNCIFIGAEDVDPSETQPTCTVQALPNLAACCAYTSGFVVPNVSDVAGEDYDCLELIAAIH